MVSCLFGDADTSEGEAEEVVVPVSRRTRSSRSRSTELVPRVNGSTVTTRTVTSSKCSTEDCASVTRENIAAWKIMPKSALHPKVLK